MAAIGGKRAAFELVGLVLVVMTLSLSIIGCGTDDVEVEVIGDCTGSYICPPGIDGPWKPSLSRSGNDCVLDQTFILDSEGELQDMQRKPVGTWSASEHDIQVCLKSEQECVTCDAVSTGGGG